MQDDSVLIWPKTTSFLAGLLSCQLSELNWIMEGMKNSRTGLRRARAACVEGGESQGKRWGKRELGRRRDSQSFRGSKQLDQLLLRRQNLAPKSGALGFSVLGRYLLR